MILFVAVVLCLLVGLARGGNWRGLLSVHLRYGWLLVVAFAAQLPVIYHPAVTGESPPSPSQHAIFLASHALIMALAWINRRVKGVRWITLGLSLNLAVLLANGGWMPVTPEAITGAGQLALVPSLVSGTRVTSSKSIILGKEHTKLWYLSDLLVLGKPFPVPSIFSPGDVVIALGACALIQKSLSSPDLRLPIEEQRSRQ